VEQLVECLTAWKTGARPDKLSEIYWPFNDTTAQTPEVTTHVHPDIKPSYRKSLVQSKPYLSLETSEMLLLVSRNPKVGGLVNYGTSASRNFPEAELLRLSTSVMQTFTGDKLPDQRTPDDVQLGYILFGGTSTSKNFLLQRATNIATVNKQKKNKLKKSHLCPFFGGDETVKNVLMLIAGRSGLTTR